MNLLIFDVFRDFGDILVTSLILGAAMACQWLVIGLSMACQWLVIRSCNGLPGAGWCLLYNEMWHILDSILLILAGVVLIV